MFSRGIIKPSALAKPSKPLLTTYHRQLKLEDCCQLLRFDDAAKLVLPQDWLGEVMTKEGNSIGGSAKTGVGWCLGKGVISTKPETTRIDIRNSEICFFDTRRLSQ